MNISNLTIEYLVRVVHSFECQLKNCTSLHSIFCLRLTHHPDVLGTRVVLKYQKYNNMQNAPFQYNELYYWIIMCFLYL